jgi:hypothetical protein
MVPLYWTPGVIVKLPVHVNEEGVPSLKLALAVVPLIVIVNSPCAPPGITTGVELEARAHDNPLSVKALMLMALLDGLLTMRVRVPLLALRDMACICSVAVFAAPPAKPKTHTATATANAIATAISIIVATTFDIPFLFMFVFIRWFLLSTT